SSLRVSSTHPLPETVRTCSFCSFHHENSVESSAIRGSLRTLAQLCGSNQTACLRASAGSQRDGEMPTSVSWIGFRPHRPKYFCDVAVRASRSLSAIDQSLAG